MQAGFCQKRAWLDFPISASCLRTYQPGQNEVTKINYNGRDIAVEQVAFEYQNSKKARSHPLVDYLVYCLAEGCATQPGDGCQSR